MNPSNNLDRFAVPLQVALAWCNRNAGRICSFYVDSQPIVDGAPPLFKVCIELRVEQAKANRVEHFALSLSEINDMSDGILEERTQALLNAMLQSAEHYRRIREDEIEAQQEQGQ